MTNPKQCAKCGQPHAPNKCQAHRKSDGLQCTNDPKHGMRVCRMHGGSSPRIVAKVAREQREVELRRQLPADFPEHTDPVRFYLQRISEIEAWLEVLRDRVRAMDDYGSDSLVLGEQIRVDVQLYTAALKESMAAVATLIKLGIDADWVARVSDLQAAPYVAAHHQASLNIGLTPVVAAAHTAEFSRLLGVGERISEL